MWINADQWVEFEVSHHEHVGQDAFECGEHCPYKRQAEAYHRVVHLTYKQTNKTSVWFQSSMPVATSCVFASSQSPPVACLYHKFYVNGVVKWDAIFV